MFFLPFFLSLFIRLSSFLLIHGMSRHPYRFEAHGWPKSMLWVNLISHDFSGGEKGRKGEVIRRWRGEDDDGGTMSVWRVHKTANAISMSNRTHTRTLRPFEISRHFLGQKMQQNKKNNKKRANTYIRPKTNNKNTVTNVGNEEMS